MQRPNVMRVFGIGLFGLAVLLTAAIAQAGYMTDIINSNPVGYWRLDDASGSATAANKISGGIAGTYHNFNASDYGQSGALTASGDNDPAVGFHGGNYISLNESVFSSSPNAFTVELWFNTASLDRSDILNYKNNSGTFDVGVFIEGGKLNLYSNGTNLHTAADSLAAGSWYHMALTRDSSGSATIYLNGNSVISGVSGFESFGSAGHDFWIGSNHDASDNPSAMYNGKIDELAIYGSAMSQPTALAHYNAGITVPEPSTAILLGSALIGLLCYAWRKRK